MTFSLYTIALILGLCTLAAAECTQPIGARPAKIPTSVEKSKISNPLSQEYYFQVTMKHTPGCCLDDVGSCYIRCVAAGYKNVYHNLVDSDKDEVYLAASDLAVMTGKCSDICSSKTHSQDAYFTFRSTSDIIPNVASTRMQSFPLRADALFPNFNPSNRIPSSGSYY